MNGKKWINMTSGLGDEIASLELDDLNWGSVEIRFSGNIYEHWYINRALLNTFTFKSSETGKIYQ